MTSQNFCSVINGWQLLHCGIFLWSRFLLQYEYRVSETISLCGASIRRSFNNNSCIFENFSFTYLGSFLSVLKVAQKTCLIICLSGHVTCKNSLLSYAKRFGAIQCLYQVFWPDFYLNTLHTTTSRYLLFQFWRRYPHFDLVLLMPQLSLDLANCRVIKCLGDRDSGHLSLGEGVKSLRNRVSKQHRPPPSQRSAPFSSHSQHLTFHFIRTRDRMHNLYSSLYPLIANY